MASATKANRRVKSSFGPYLEGRVTPEIRMTVHLVLAARRWRSLLDEKLRPIDQSAARMEAMAAIISSPPLSPQVDIAKRLRIEGPTLTRMLDALEKDSMVERLPDRRDRRTKQLRVTDEGKQALEQIFGVADELRARLFDGYSEEELNTINAFLLEIVSRLDAGLPESE